MSGVDDGEQQRIERLEDAWAKVHRGMVSDGTDSALHGQGQKHVLADLMRRYAGKGVEAQPKEWAERYSAHKDFVSWWKLCATSELRLERNDQSRMHKLVESAFENRILSANNTDDLRGPVVLQNVKHIFVVRHDWAGAFDGAVVDGAGPEIRLPYDLCAFEFRIHSKPVIYVIRELPGEVPSVAFVGLGSGWAPIRKSENDEPSWRFETFLRSQVRAICISLDAQIAETEVIRAPAKLNEKRAAKGRVPLLDYHVVDLAKRHKVSAAKMGGEGIKRRLHFRRGHWRHLSTHNVWIRWCLVGDPSLGFVGKHYAL